MDIGRENRTSTTTRLIRGLACGTASLALVAGLAVMPFDMTAAYATPAEEDTHYVGSTELSAEDAQERAQEATEEVPPTEEFASQKQLIVEMFPGVDENVVLGVAIGDSGLKVVKNLMPATDEFGGMYLVSVPADMELQDAKALLLENTQIAGVSYDIIMQADDLGNEGEPEAVAAEATNPNPYANDSGLATKWEDNAAYLDFQGTWDTAYAAGWRDSSSVTIAVVDSGINATHNDLKDNIVASYDATGKNDISDILASGHGTSVAGIASARTGNGVGTASLAYNAKLLPIKVFSQTEQGQVGALLSDVISGMNWLLTSNSSLGGKTPAAQYNVKVLNLSIGFPTQLVTSPTEKTAMANAIQNLWNEGIVVVNSMGNNEYKDNNNNPIAVPYDHWPTSQSKNYCVGVIALEQDSSSSAAGAVKVDYQSNYNLSASDLVGKIAAPGRNIYTTGKANNTSYVSNFSGTSAATPQVSSLLAMMYAIYPEMTPAQATNFLYSNARKDGALNNKQLVGNGMMNPEATIQDVIAAKADAYASENDLKNLVAKVGGTKYEDFNYLVSSFNENYGTVTSSPDVTLTFEGRPALWTLSTSSNEKTATSTDSTGKVIESHTRVTTATFTSANNNASGNKVTKTYTFTFKWDIVTNDPQAAKIAELANMTASVNGTQLTDFNYTKTAYYKGYGKIAATQQLPSQVNLSVPAGWTVTANSSNPLVDTNIQQIASDGTTTGNREKKLEYTVKSDDNLVTRTYAFTFTGNYTDDSTRYTNVLKNIKLQIDGNDYSNFNVNTKTYRIKEASASALDDVTAPTFTNLPQGWTQACSEPTDDLTYVDNGNGTVTQTSSLKYVITLSNANGGKIQYTVIFYAESVQDATEHQESSDTGHATQASDTSGKGGTLNAPAVSAPPATATPVSSPTPLQSPSVPSNSTQAQQQTQQVQQTQQTQKAQQTQQTQQTQQRQQGTGTLTQTGDATATIALATIAGGTVALALIQRRKHDHKA